VNDLLFQVGGGVVGASLACRLAQTVGKSHGYRICLVEGRPPKPVEQVKAGSIPDPRVFSMTPASVKFLEEVGSWQALGERSQPFEMMQVREVTLMRMMMVMMIMMMMKMTNTRRIPDTDQNVIMVVAV